MANEKPRREWANLTLDVIPDAVPDAIGTLRRKVLAPLEELIALMAVALRAGELLLLAAIDPVLAAISLVIDAFNEILDKLKLSAGMHVLFVPLTVVDDKPKTGGGVDTTWLFSYEEFPVLLTRPQTPGGSGGNWGFFTTVAESVADESDFGRPDYPTNHHLVGLVLMFGAPSPGALLKKIFALIRLFGELAPLPLDQYELPVPQNLAVRNFAPLGPQPPMLDAIFSGSGVAQGDAAPEGSAEGEMSIILTWDLPDIFKTSALWATTTYEITDVFVYMKEGNDFTSTDVGNRLAEYSIGRFNNPLVTRYMVRNVDPQKTLYFAVGYKVKIVSDIDPDPDVDPVIEYIDHYDISNSVRVNLDEIGGDGLPGGELPDWRGVRSALSLFPPIQQAIEELQALLTSIQDNLLGSLIEDFERFVTAIERSLLNLLAKIEKIDAALLDLQTFLDALSFDLYAYGFYGKGGTPYLVSELNQALFDVNTLNKPPFEDGSSVVGGVVAVAAAKDLNFVVSVVDFLSLLFGDIFAKTQGRSVVSSGRATPSPTLEDAVASIEVFAADAVSGAEALEAAADIGDNPGGTSAEGTAIIPAGEC